MSTGVLSLTACLMLWTALLIRSAEAQDIGAASVLIHFDLAAQPLADAIDAYGRATGLSVFVKSELLDGRAGAPLHGDFTAADALRRLLEGTGLQMAASADGIAIIPADALSAAPRPEPATSAIPASEIAGAQIDGEDYRWYAADLQMQLTRALCEDPRTYPGTYRLLIQLTIGSSGEVVSSRLLGSTGSVERDAAIVRAARSITLDAAPPATLPQPVTILLHPFASGVVDACAPAGTQDGRP